MFLMVFWVKRRHKQVLLNILVVTKSKVKKQHIYTTKIENNIRTVPFKISKTVSPPITPKVQYNYRTITQINCILNLSF